jgi:hypothetical protein
VVLEVNTRAHRLALSEREEALARTLAWARTHLAVPAIP